MITVYSTSWCGPCKSVKALFDKNNITYEVVDIEEDREAMHFLMNETGKRTVPQIFRDGEYLGTGVSVAMQICNEERDSGVPLPL